MRNLIRRIVQHAPLCVLPRVARILYPGLEIPQENRPNLLVTSSFQTTYLSRILARLNGAMTVFSGTLHPPRSQWFDVVVSPVEMEMPNALCSSTLTTDLNPSMARDAANALWPDGPPTRCWTILIGGGNNSSSDSSFASSEEWRALAHEMNRLAKEHGIRWLITTSRRTGAEAEAILRESLASEAIEEAVWWSQEPKKTVAAFIHAGEHVYVTEDSATMISEALTIKGRVEMISSAQECHGTKNVYIRFLQKAEEMGCLRRHHISTLNSPEASPPTDFIQRQQEAFTKEFVSRILELIARNGFSEELKRVTAGH